MRSKAVVLALMLEVACGGESERDSPSPGSEGGSRQGSGGITGGGAGSGGSAPGGSGSAGAGAQAGTSYVPEDPNVPAAGDGRLTGGSFEGNLGAGWDFCHTRNPGADLRMDGTSSSDGKAWLAFDSRKSCSESFACQADGDDVQLGLWLDAGLPPEVPVHLYFDAVNLSQASPSGIFHFGGLPFDDGRSLCKSVPLAAIPLLDLELTSEWATRCLTFTPNEAFSVLGLYVTGEAFHLGLDAFRFGPPCGNGT
jgi:hypothetical protein